MSRGRARAFLMAQGLIADTQTFESGVVIQTYHPGAS